MTDLRLLRAFCWLPLLLGCAPDDKDHLEAIGEKLRDRVIDLSESTPLPALPATVPPLQAIPTDRADLAARVQSRLQADKMLAGTTIQVQSTGTTIVLTGTVRDLTQRRRAVDLAEQTIGVEALTDQLTISPP